MPITINGKVYRTLEEQVLDNQQTSNDAKDTAVVATQAVSAITGAVNELQTQMEQVAIVFDNLREEIEEIKSSVPVLWNEVNEAVKGTMGTVTSNWWHGKLYFDGTFDVYTTIIASYTPEHSYDYTANINKAVFGNSNEMMLLPEAISDTIGAKEVFAFENASNWKPKGFELSSGPLVTNPGTNEWNPEGQIYSGTSYPMNLVINVKGRHRL